MKHANLSIFIPHLGCPHQCSFCNQQTISGCATAPSAPQVRAICQKALETMPEGREAEIAFFGGSFTALERGYMEELLAAASPFVEQGRFMGIRVSTRPDAVDESVLALLRAYRVTSVELGAQSMSDSVLAQNQRGHNSIAVEHAAAAVKKAGFSLGLQMMTGLFGATEKQDLDTARRLAALAPDTLRIYPTIVLRGTQLERAYLEKRYQPQTLEQAVLLCAELLDYFDKCRIKVIRVGLHDEPSLKSERVAGPYHPAFRELCQGALMARRIADAMQASARKSAVVFVGPRSLSKMLGHGAFPVEYLRRLGYNVTVKKDETLTELEFRISPVGD